MPKPKPVMYEIELTRERFARSRNVYDAVLLGTAADGALEYAADFDTAMKTGILFVPNKRIIVSAELADALAAIGTAAPRKRVRLIDSDLETRAPRLGGAVRDDYVQLNIPDLAAALDYTRTTATPRSVYISRASANPVMEEEATMPGLFYYGGRPKLWVSAPAAALFAEAQAVTVLEGRGTRREEGRTTDMERIVDGEAPPAAMHELDLAEKDAHGFTLLFYAAEVGSAAWVDGLLEAGADVHTRNAREMTPVMVAAYRGHSDIVDKLVAAGADVSVQDRAGWSLSQWTAYRGDVDLALRFRDIAGGAETPDPFRIAVLRCHEELVTAMVDTGDISADALNEAVPAVFAASDDNAAAIHRPAFARVIHLLLKLGADMASAGLSEVKWMWHAAFQPSTDLMQELFQRGIHPDVGESGKETVLARVSDAELDGGPEARARIRALLEAGADPTLEDSFGSSAIISARRRIKSATANRYVTPEQLSAMQENLALLEEYAARQKSP